MKQDLHPTYHADAKVVCACGNTFTVGSTMPELHIDICSTCHPFYTGKQKLVDTARRVERFQERTSKQAAAATERKGKKVKKAKADARKKEARKVEKDEA
jgi:large subunit ribosomal protein L31